MEALCEDMVSNASRAQAEYFRAGPGARLHVRAEDGAVLWRFHFLDLGMVHEIRGCARVTECAGGVRVQGRAVRSLEQAMRAAFGGRYRRYVGRMRARMGIR